jgi:polysaccharide biosynthesis transport protein
MPQDRPPRWEQTSLSVGPPSPTEESADWGRLLGALARAPRRNIALILGSVALAILGAVGYALSQTKVYRAAAIIEVDPRPPRPLGHNVETVSDVGTGSWWSEQEYYNTQHRIIGSRRIALSVARELGLGSDPGFIANKPGRPPGPFKPESPERAADILRSRSNVTLIKESSLFEITVEDADPARAVRLVDATVRAYMTNNLETATESTSVAVDWLADQLEGLRSELSESELALHRYKHEKRITSVNLDDQTSTIQSEIRQLVEARAKVRAEIQKATARVKQLESVDLSDPNTIPETELFKSQNLNPLRAEFQKLMRERNAQVGSGKGENHPNVQALDAQIGTITRAISSELRNVQLGAEKELQALRGEDGGLSSLLVQSEQRAIDLNLLQIEYGRLERTKINNEKLYGIVLERTKEAGLAKMLRVNNVHIVDPPIAGPAPVKPQVGLIVALGGIGGVLVGLLAALVRDRLDRTVQTKTDIEERTGLVALGAIPALEGGGGGHKGLRGLRRRSRTDETLAPAELSANPRGPLAEEVRTIRTNLLFMSPDKPLRRLLVTSPSPSEGKTTVTACLGMTMAQAGHRVLLVDCDMRRPRLHTAFPGMQSTSTLSESLIHPASLDPASLRTEFPNLSVLPAGPPPPNPAELLHSDAFQHLMDRLGSDYDFILLDTPPLVVTDAAILAQRVDGCILVVRAHVTEYPTIARALRTLRDVGAPIAGAVLNGIRSEKSGYGYTKYGGYGAYGPTNPTPEAKPT